MRDDILQYWKLGLQRRELMYEGKCYDDIEDELEVVWWRTTDEGRDLMRSFDVQWNLVEKACNAR